jgi:hypothetical protein
MYNHPFSCVERKPNKKALGTACGVNEKEVIILSQSKNVPCFEIKVHVNTYQKYYFYLNSQNTKMIDKFDFFSQEKPPRGAYSG